MKTVTTYKVKIKHYNKIFNDTLKVYRSAVDYLIGVCLDVWDSLSEINSFKGQKSMIEKLVHHTKDNPSVRYDDFDTLFYKFPSYLRRAAIAEAIGKVSSYKSNLEHNPNTGFPKAGYTYPVMYKDNMYEPVDDHHARIKVFIRGTWDWLDVEFRKSDADYIKRHCSNRKQLSPTLVKKGREVTLDFPFEEQTALHDKNVFDTRIISVDLGILNSATCTCMRYDGTIHGRHFLKLPVETDRLDHAIGRIKKAQSLGAKRMPALWGAAKGINRDIAVKTVNFIMDIAIMYDADTIVFEHLDIGGKKRGSKKQRLHMWKARDVQNMVTSKAHRLGMRIARINAWGTSKLAFDGSGRVERGTYMQNGKEVHNYSVCVFPSGKTYNCDLNATYNIGARFFIREILKTLPETARLALEAKVPQAAKRSTCTLSMLISLNAELSALCC